MNKKIIIGILAVMLTISLLASSFGCGPPRLRVATTTSLYDTGLWDYLEPFFEEEYGVELAIISAGTGIALEYGMRGDVDIIAVHSRAREEQFVADGYGVERVPFAYNYFLIVGPPDDPAGIQGMGPEEAFQTIYNAGLNDPDAVLFISRGDDSGTHGKEQAIWASAGYDYEEVTSGDWYVEAARGMGPTLLMANEMQGYTLTDIGTFLAYQGELELVPLVEEGAILLNVYSAIAIDPAMHPDTDITMANNLIAFLTSPEGQQLIGEYGVAEYGRPLFFPCAGAEPES